MQQYLRLHASMDDFSATVQKARRFASTTETSRPRKSVRINSPSPSHDAIQVIDGQSSLHEKVDKIESMIRSMQTTTPRATTPPSGGSSVKYANSGGKSPKQPPSQTSKGERPQKMIIAHPHRSAQMVKNRANNMLSHLKTDRIHSLVPNNGPPVNRNLLIVGG